MHFKNEIILAVWRNYWILHKSKRWKCIKYCGLLRDWNWMIFSKTGSIFEYQNKNSTGGLGCILFKRSKKSRVFIKLFIRKWLEHRIVSIAIFWIYKWRILLSIVMNYLCMYNDLYFIQIGIIPEFGGLVGNYSAYCGLFLRIKLKIVKSS